MDSTPAQRAAFAAALARELDGRNRTQFAAAVATAAGETVSDNAIVLWISGKTEPTRPKVAAMEKVLDLAPGALSQHLGYLPVGAVPALTPEDAVAKDTSVPRHVRAIVLDILAGARKRTG